MKKAIILTAFLLSGCVVYPDQGPVGYAPAYPAYVGVDYNDGWYGRRYIPAPGRWHHYESPHMRGGHGEAPAHGSPDHDTHAHSSPAHGHPAHNDQGPTR